MSIDSALIVRKDALPTAAELATAIAGTGVTVAFPADFRLDRSAAGWVDVTVDGEATGFDYGVDALADLDAEAAPRKLRKHGDTLLSFGARGSLSAETVSLIQRVMAGRWGAAGWIQEDLIPPEEMASDGEPTAGMDPDMAALMRGSPAERAAATEAYVARYHPPVSAAARRADVMNIVRPLIIPAIIVLIFAALFLWIRLK